MTQRIYIGLDLGKIQHYSAMTVARQEGDVATGTERLVIQHAERMRPGLPYHGVVARVAKVVRAILPKPTAEEKMMRTMAGIKRPPRATIDVVMDATGVGEPVVEMFQLADMEAIIWPIKMIGEGTVRFDEVSMRWHVPKNDLIEDIEIRANVEPPRLLIPPGLEAADALREELGKIRTKILERGVKYEYEREAGDDARSHGDLAISLALLCWCATRGGSAGEIRHV